MPCLLVTTALALLLADSSAVAAPLGFRGDGSGRVDLVLDWRPDRPPTWTLPLSGARSGLASPVAFQGLVVFTVEPFRIVALDAGQGTERWSLTLDPIDARPAAEQAPLRLRRESASQARAALPAALERLARARRARRTRGAGPDALAESEAASRDLDALVARAAADEGFALQPAQDDIGTMAPRR